MCQGKTTSQMIAHFWIRNCNCLIRNEEAQRIEHFQSELFAFSLKMFNSPSSFILYKTVELSNEKILLGPIYLPSSFRVIASPLSLKSQVCSQRRMSECDSLTRLKIIREMVTVVSYLFINHAVEETKENRLVTLQRVY